MKRPPRAVLFVAWGDPYVETINECIAAPGFPNYPIHLITDKETSVSSLPPDIHVTRIDFHLGGKTRKAEMVRGFPDEEVTYLFLDTDTRVLLDVSFGFEKAERHGMAMAQAAHYCMDHFQHFASVMNEEGVSPQGQLLYNSGVIFFRLRPDVRDVFDLFYRLATKHAGKRWSDQPYLTLAIEIKNFNPYTLTTGYNHRAFGELISGEIRIWHSRHSVPPNVNALTPPFPRVFDGTQIVKHAVPAPPPAGFSKHSPPK